MCKVHGTIYLISECLPSLQIAQPKAGDVAGEKLVEERIRQLGLLDTKRGMEQSLAQRLEHNMEQDQLIGKINYWKIENLLNIV